MKSANTVIYTHRIFGNWTATHPAIGRFRNRQLDAVKLSSLPGVLIQDVASALDIHPFMLSPWRNQARDGVIVDKVRS